MGDPLPSAQASPRGAHAAGRATSLVAIVRRYGRAARVRDASLALTGAVLMGASAPPSHAWLAGLFVWVPLARIAIDGDPRRAARLGWLQGTIAQAIVLAGIPEAVHRVAGTSWIVSAVLYAVLVLAEGGRQGVTGFLAGLAVRRGWPLALAFPAAVTTAELLYPLFFPWTTALFVSSAPLFLQIADWGGRLAISFSIALASAFFAQAWANGREGLRAAARPLAFASCVWAAHAAYGGLRLLEVDRTVEGASPLSIGAIQGALPDAPGPARDDALAYRDATIAHLAGVRPDLIVWPEAALTDPVDEDMLSGLFARVFRPPLQTPSASTPSARMEAPLLTGIMLRHRSDEGPAHMRANAASTKDPNRGFRYTNAAVLVTPEARVRGIYEKQTLVALGEYIPGETAMPWLRRLLPWGGHLSAASSGATSGALHLGDARLSVSICYEDILPEAIRQAVVRDDPDLLVNLTSDSWFEGSRIPYLHLYLAALRSVEHRRFLVQVTTNGITAAIDPAGRTIMSLAPAQTAAGVATVRRLRGRTVYAALGDAPWVAVAVALLAMLLVPRRRAQMRSRIDTPGACGQGAPDEGSSI